MTIQRAIMIGALIAFSWRPATLAQSRWIELDYDESTTTYDLTTVQMLDPGRFTISSNSQDHPDVIQLKLAVLTTLKSYCGRPDGEYVPSSELFTLGSPDMPVENIKVETLPGAGIGPFKHVVWDLPYRRLALKYPNGSKENIEFFDCNGRVSDDKEYDVLQSLIMNGTALKTLYDCRHGVLGFFLNTDDPPSKAITGTNIQGGYLDAYLRLCPVIVGGSPYMPNSSQNR